MNPGLTEMMAKDRITELRAGATRRSSRSGPPPPTTAGPVSSRSSPRVRPVNAQRAIGWFLVSVGLRLAMPRTPTGTGR
jgi:hypothetical protein